MISILMNEPYFDIKLLDFLDKDPTWGIQTYFLCDPMPIIKDLLTSFETNQYAPMILKDRKNGTETFGKEAVAEFIEKNISVIETITLDLIFARFHNFLIAEEKYSIKELSEISGEFYLAPTNRKCEILLIDDYIQNRNLLSLFKKYKTLEKYQTRRVVF